MIHGAQEVADIMQEGGNDELLVAPVAMGTGRGLQRMGQSVHLLAFIAVLELRKGIQNSARQVALEAGEMAEDQVVILLRSLRHGAVAGNAFDSGSIRHLNSLSFR